MTASARLAAFDFDGTLTTRDSVGGFAFRIARRHLGSTLGRGVLHAGPLAIAIARRDRDRVRAVATQIVFTGVAAETVAEVATEYAQSIIAGRLRESMIDELRAQQDAGATTVIVSASYEDYLVPVADHLDIDAVIGTRLEVRDGACTGALIGGNCRGPEKVHRLEAWMQDRGLERPDVEMWAYGDSSGDREMLASADHPRWVGTQSNNL